MSTKACTRCGRVLSLSAFGKHRLGKDGLNYWCKECNKERAQEYSQTASGIFTSIKSRVKYRAKNPRRWGMKKDFNITREDFIKWYNIQPKTCFYCGVAETDLTTIHDSYNSRSLRLTVDCKDNDRGYEIDNLVLSCQRCNTTKNDFFTWEEMRWIGQNFIRQKWYEKRKESAKK